MSLIRARRRHYNTVPSHVRSLIIRLSPCDAAVSMHSSSLPPTVPLAPNPCPHHPTINSLHVPQLRPQASLVAADSQRTNARLLASLPHAMYPLAALPVLECMYVQTHVLVVCIEHI